MNILRKGSIFLFFFCKKGAFHLPTLQVSGDHLPTFNFQGIFVSSQGTVLLFVPPGIFGLLGVAAIQGCLRDGSGPQELAWTSSPPPGEEGHGFIAGRK